jgi:hypothetical protein
MDDGFAETTREPTIEAVQASLDAVLACTELRLSERNRRFLAFVVSETVAGNAERIKAYSIGVDVFGRDDSFDPTTDPIVRIEATRIRTALAAYYIGPGLGDSIRISIPPGSYVPSFSWSPRSCPISFPPAAAMLPAVTSALPSSGVLASPLHARAVIVIQDHSPRCDPETALRGELFSDALVRFAAIADLRVHLVPSSDRSAALAAIQRIFSSPADAFSLDVAVRPLLGQRRYSWRFSDLSTGEILLADHSDQDIAAPPCLDVIDGIAKKIAERAAAIAVRTTRQASAAP